MAAERRLLFGQVAELYDRARPGYPEQLVEDVLAFSGAQAGDRALEIGAGTGKATRSFAARGLAVVALEPSRQMAEVARRNLAEADVEVVEAEFESWDGAGEAFGLAYSAQAWHWVASAGGYQRARRCLQPGGSLAVFWNRPRWERTRLRGEISGIYRRQAPELVDRPGPMHPDNPDDSHWMTDWDPEAAAAAGFGVPESRDYDWPHVYSSREYALLLGTHSDHLTLGPERLAALQAAVSQAIDRRGGRLEMQYTTRLLMARVLA
jgi:SAM-dependent methyltransferase